MRSTAPIIAAFLAAAPALGQGTEGARALAGLEDVASSVCGHGAATVDPGGLVTGLEGVIGDAMGLRNGDSIIGTIYASDPEAGARMWAATLAGSAAGCATLVRMLSVPAAETIVGLN